jgi:hypothetical protein
MLFFRFYAAVLILGTSAAGRGSEMQAQEPVSFMRQIAPLLRENCLACHDAKKHKGRLQMTSFAGLLQGGAHGEIVVPGKPEESTLYLFVSGQEEPSMPPKEAGGKLPAEKIDLIKRWIVQGCKFDGSSRAADFAAELRKLWRPPLPPDAYAHPMMVRSLVFSPDGQSLIVGGYHELLVWDWAGPRLRARIRTRAERANDMVFLRDGQTLAVAGGRPGQEGDVRLYWIPRKFKANEVETIDATGLKSEAMVRELVQTDDEMLCLALSPDGKRLAAGGTDRLIRLWDLENRDAHSIPAIENHSDWVLSLAFSPDGQRLLSGSRDRTAKVWSLQKKASELTFSDHQQPVHSVAAKPEGDAFYSGGDDHLIRLVAPPLPGKQQRKPLGGFKLGVTRMAFRPETSQLLAASADGTVRVINIENGSIVRQLTGNTEWVYALALSPNGKLAATGSWNGEVRIWEIDSGKKVAVFQASPGLTNGK